MTFNQVGGKFYRLKHLTEMGFQVPRFFCLTTGFFNEVYKPIEHQVSAQIESIDFKNNESVIQAAGNIKDIFCTIRYKKYQEEQIINAFDCYLGSNKHVAVRSSMVADHIHESEDSDEHSFAGMSDSYLFVDKKELLDKILLCWASGFSAECLMYRHIQRMNPSAIKVAVGVQEMIDGKRSFVLFTCNPANSARDAVITAGYGIGEGVVQERVPLDHYFVNFRTNDISARIAEKDIALISGKEKGSAIVSELIIDKVPDELRNQAVLNQREITGLVHAGRKMERFFGMPQDIEGTFDSSNRLFFLQSRPVNLNQEIKRVWTDANISESFSGVTTALTYSFACFFYRLIFYDQHRKKGIPQNILHDNDVHFSHMLGFINNRIYYSVDTFCRLLSLDILFSSTDWENMIGLSTSYLTEGYGIKTQYPKDATYRLKWIQAFIRAWVSSVKLPNDFNRFFAWWHHLMDTRRNPAYFKKDPIALISDFNEVWRDVGNHWGTTLINDGNLSFISGIVNRLIKKTHLEPGFINDLLCGGEHPLSSRIVLSGISLAEMIRQDNTLKKLFMTPDEREIWKKLENGEVDEAFTHAVKHHLKMYGDRGMQELKIEVPNLRKTPWLLLSMIKQYIHLDINKIDITAHDKEIRLNAEKKLFKNLWRHPIRLMFIRQAVNKLRTHIKYREDSRYCRSELFGYSKNIFYSLGEELFSQGRLEKEDDFLHLTMEELFGAFNGTGVTQDLKSLAAIRRKEYALRLSQYHKDRPAASEFTTVGTVTEDANTQFETEKNHKSILKGIGSSAGKAIGNARVILDPAAANHLNKNDILITRETDPGWLFLMVCAGGLVVERGSMLSHSAIIGRKLGIPTIVAVENATQYINDGAEIEIDGSSGVIKLR